MQEQVFVKNKCVFGVFVTPKSEKGGTYWNSFRQMSVV